jgi:peptide methionine sulfoxide reductase MsrA
MARCSKCGTAVVTGLVTCNECDPGKDYRSEIFALDREVQGLRALLTEERKLRIESIETDGKLINRLTAEVEALKKRLEAADAYLEYCDERDEDMSNWSRGDCEEGGRLWEAYLEAKEEARKEADYAEC